jgi:hypothetical protein
MKLYKKTLILFICLLPLLFNVQAQSTSKKQKKIALQKEKKDAEALKKYQKALKAHNDHQTKDTRKRMRQSRKKSRENDPNHKEFFLKRWFSGLKKK